MAQEFIVHTDSGYIESLNRFNPDETVFTGNRNLAQRFSGQYWLEFFVSIPGTTIIHIIPEDQRMRAKGQPELPGME